MRFADLVSPVTPDEFLARYWTREAALLRSPNRQFAPYFGWEALNALLNAGELTHPTVVVGREDEVVPPAAFTTGGTVNPVAVMQHFREGASFSIRGAGTLTPSLRPIVDCLYDTFLEPTHANVYCSPANVQGFRAHYDLHEVFVLQIEGAKHWRIFKPTTEFPVYPWKPEDDPTGSVQPYLDVVVEQGDVLYVPRGHWHYAVAVDSTSLHITCGVTTRKATAFLEWLATDVNDGAAWRANLPMRAIVAGDGAEFSAWAAELRAELTRRLGDPDVFDRFARETLAGVQPRATVQMPLSGEPGKIDLATAAFKRPPGRPYKVDDADGGVIVTAGGASIELEGFPAAFIERVFGAESFTLADARGWDSTLDAANITELLESLVEAGLLNTAR